jgi:hypothetical protein
LIVQEDLVSEIADTFMAVVRPLGCVVKATGRHDCMAARGVKCHEASMTTVALRGVFREKPSLTEEFHQVLSTGGERLRMATIGDWSQSGLKTLQSAINARIRRKEER